MIARIEVIAAASPEWNAAIHAVAESTYQISTCKDMAGLVGRLERVPADVVFLDPTLVTEPGGLAALGVLLMRARAACVFCTNVSPLALRAVAAAASLEPRNILIDEHDLRESQVADTLRNVVSQRVEAEIADALDLVPRRLPHRLRYVIQRLLRQPERYFDAEDVAKHAGMSRRNVDRVLNGAGVASARRLVVAVRVLHAVDRLVRQRRSVTETAASLGYANRTVLTRQIKAVLQRTPTQIVYGQQSPEIYGAARRFVSRRDGRAAESI